MRRVPFKGSVLQLGVAAMLCGCASALMPPPVPALAAQGNETPYAASRIVWRWRTVMNLALEDMRAFASEDVVDALEVFVSPGAVRVVQDKATEEQLKKADAVLQRLVAEMVKASERQPDGSVIVDERAIEPARKAICPVYPFCDR